MNDIKYDWNNISIVPATISGIDSRKEISIKRDGKLPLFVAPMDMVVDEENVDLFLEEGYNVCMPRGIEPGQKEDDLFYSYGLDEIIRILDDHLFLPKKVLIDVANGHMKKLYDTAKRLKEERPEVELMIGNIANPETYRKYCEIGVDWIRVSIGSGSACHIKGTKIKTKNDVKNIEDLIVGDIVLSHKNNYKKISNIHILESGNLYQINDNTVTGDHKYYVLNKKYENIVTDDNIHDYAGWVCVEDLNDEYFLLGINDDV